MNLAGHANGAPALDVKKIKNISVWKTGAAVSKKQLAIKKNLNFNQT